MTTLADLYNADKRITEKTTRRLAESLYIPHPLNNVQYADGISKCRHAKRHKRFQWCNQEVRES